MTGVALLDLWERFGRLPALGVVVAAFAAYAVLWLTGDGDATAITGATLFVLFLLYCFARPQGGLDVFGAVMLPGFVGQITEAIGGPSWVGLLAIPLGLVIALEVDRDQRSAAAKPS